MTEDTKLRLFAALELPDDWRRELGHVVAELGRVGSRDLKLVRPEQMHVTLVFMGYQPPSCLAAIQAAMASAGSEVPPFHLSLGQIGYFGPPHGIQVVCVGLAHVPAELQQLHQALVDHLSAAGVSFDRKPLVPHITLARTRRPVDRSVSLRLHAAIQRLRIPSGLDVEVVNFVLMQSHLSRLGPDYQVVARFRLGGATQ